MENTEVTIESTENDDNESTDSSLCIIMAEELDKDIKDNDKPSVSGSKYFENKEIHSQSEHDDISQNEDTEDSFSAMTQSQYAQV